MLIVTLFQTKPCPLTVFNNKTRPPTGSVNLQRSYEICRAVVEKSANRAKVEAQLVAPPASKQRRLSATSAASVASALPVSLPPGATILVQAAPAPAPAPATSAAVVSGVAATNVVTAAAVKPPPTFTFGPRLAVAGPLAVRGLRPPAGGQLPVAGVTGIRLKLPASAVPVSGGQVVLQRPLLPHQPQAIVVRTSNPFSLQTSAASLVKAVPGSLVAASSSLPPAPAAVSCALTSSSPPACLLAAAAVPGPGGQAAPPPVALSPCSPVSMTNNNLFSNSFNISTVAPRTITTLSSSPSLLPSSPCLPPPPPPAAPQFIIRYLAAPPAAAVPSPLVASAGAKHFIVQPQPAPAGPAPLPSDKPSLQVSCAPQLVTRLPAPAPTPTPPSSPSPKSPKAASFNPASIIQQITQPCTPPPPPAPPVSLVQTSPRVRQQVVYRAAKPIQRIIIPPQHNNIVTKQQPQQLQSVFTSPQLVVKAEDENFTKPLPPIQTNIKTVRTTLVPRSPVSDDQISSILGSCVPEPQAVCRISPEDKEKASAVAALAANNFDEGKLSPTKVVSPGLSPSGGSSSSSSSMFPIIQPLEIPENGTEVADVESSLENVTIPEIAEDISNDDKPKDKSAPLTLSNSRIVLKVGFCLLLLYPSGTYLCMHDV